MIAALSFRVDRPEPLTSRLHVLAGAVRHLTHRRSGFAYRPGDFVVVEAEHLAQNEHRPLVGCQRLQQHQHGHRNRFRENDVGGRIALVEQNRLRQPRPDVVLATTGPRPQRVERLARHQLREIGLGVAHRREVHIGPPQIAVLQHIVGFGCRTEDFVDDREQQRPQVGEPLGVFTPCGGRCRAVGGHGFVTTWSATCLHGTLAALEDEARSGLARLLAKAPQRALADGLLHLCGQPTAEVDR